MIKRNQAEGGTEASSLPNSPYKLEGTMQCTRGELLQSYLAIDSVHNTPDQPAKMCSQVQQWQVCYGADEFAF